MSQPTRSMMGLALVCALVVAFASVADASAATPSRVVDLCGEGPVMAEDLCNVESGLRDAFLLVEQITDAPDFPADGRVGGVVRRQQVAVEWYPSTDPGALRPGLVGLYLPATRQVLLPPALRDEPIRVRVAVLAHELGHASWAENGLGEAQSRGQACVEDELRAYRIGIQTYERALRIVEERDPPAGQIDRFLAEDVETWRQLSGGGPLTAAALSDLANRHLFLRGYAETCGWR